MMKIAVASGKGGTGKTTLSIALTQAISGKVTLLDCDVEEPNCHLFFPVELDETLPVTVLIPVVDEDLCNSCGKCAEMCQFNAIICMDIDPAMVFPALCHSCGGCALVCETGAISEEECVIGCIEKRTIAQDKTLISGRLNIGYSLAPTVIRAVNREQSDNQITIIDAPPGTACPFVATVSESDFTILVTEPTKFGLHDLSLAVATLREMKRHFGVVINRSEQAENMVTDYCQQENIPVLLQIPASRKIAESYSRGGSLLDVMPEMKLDLLAMLKQIQAMIGSKI
ncbi:P-loop NTPase [Psychromonas antarctica]|uniref:nucleotide-binding protein n=1 Tax=Psychromonas antarctica TaxID=67573 RepID=UPI001EE7FC17|nr:ATP-binding protein [Psychromonas antarctica]MCG6200511.1 ATP-binding protein [Psychromonas antarctica]